MRTVLGVMFLTGCGPATAGIEDGSPNSFGTSDPSNNTDTNDTDDPSGVVWVDAEGTVVEEVVELPEGLAFEDQDGFYWAIDVNGQGADAFVRFPNGAPVSVGFVDSGCSDERILSDVILPPRYVMLGYGSNARSFTAQDGAVPQQFTYIYSGSGDDCSGILNPAEALTYDEVVEVMPPTVYWVAPLHPESL